jgi:hypothetical protein
MPNIVFLPVGCEEEAEETRVDDVVVEEEEEEEEEGFGVEDASLLVGIGVERAGEDDAGLEDATTGVDEGTTGVDEGTTGVDEGTTGVGEAGLDEATTGVDEAASDDGEAGVLAEADVAPDDAGLEDKRPHFPKPFWHPSPQ